MFSRKDKDNRKPFYWGTGVFTFVYTIWVVLVNIEIALSLFDLLQLKETEFNIMDYLKIFTPLIIGGIIFGFVYLFYKMKDLIQSYLYTHRNNHLIQRRINEIVADSLDKKGDSQLKAFIEHHGDNPMDKYIGLNNPSISREDMKKIITAFEAEDQKFQKPIY